MQNNHYYIFPAKTLGGCPHDKLYVAMNTEFLDARGRHFLTNWPYLDSFPDTLVEVDLRERLRIGNDQQIPRDYDLEFTFSTPNGKRIARCNEYDNWIVSLDDLTEEDSISFVRSFHKKVRTEMSRYRDARPTSLSLQ